MSERRGRACANTYTEERVGLPALVLAAVENRLTMQLIRREVQISVGADRQCVRPQHARVVLVAHAAYLAYFANNDRIAGSFMFCGVTVTTSTKRV